MQQTKPNASWRRLLMADVALVSAAADDYDNICIAAACAYIFLQPEVDFMHFATVYTLFKNYCATFFMNSVAASFCLLSVVYLSCGRGSAFDKSLPHKKPI